jgi:hypothetical protein
VKVERSALDPDAQIVEIQDELTAVGISGDEIKQPRSAKEFRAVVPVLLKWLPLATGNAKQAVLAALKHPEAAHVEEVAPALLREFQREGTELYRWSLGDALVFAGTEAVFGDIVEVLQTGSFGADRQMLTNAIAKIDPARAQPILVGCLGDETINGHAVKALRKIRARVPASVITPFCDDDRAWVRREARRLREMNTAE